MRHVLYIPRGDVPLTDHDALQQALRSQGWGVELATSPEQAQQLLGQHEFNVALTQFSPNDSPGAFDINDMLAADMHTRWIALLERNVVQDTSVCRFVSEAFFDYHTLPIDFPRLLTTLGHAHGMARLSRESSAIQGTQGDEPELVGSSCAMLDLFRSIRKVASVEPPVLITGESGTGKELVARAIHERSQRSSGPFVAVNCAALPATLIHSELFGHEKGAFTGANRRVIGHVEAADGGTILLDEIGDLPGDLQVNLLRFLQEGTLRRLGQREEVQVDVRVLAATHVDLERAVNEQRFREDLYFRLNVLRVHIPALRERGADIELLARFFYKQFARDKNPQVKGFSPQAINSLLQHHWPGNVRELINRVRRAMVMGEGRLISASDLGLTEDPVIRPISTLAEVRQRAERDLLERTLSHTAYNLSQAAQILDISRPALYRLMSKHELSR